MGCLRLFGRSARDPGAHVAAPEQFAPTDAPAAPHAPFARLEAGPIAPRVPLFVRPRLTIPPPRGRVPHDANVESVPGCGIPEEIEAAHAAAIERGEPATPRRQLAMPTLPSEAKRGVDTLASAQDLARWHSYCSRRYNPEIPLVDRTRYRHYLGFAAPYWEVAPETSGLKLLGDASKFTVDGRVRIPIHGADFVRRQALEKHFGRRPDGYLLTEMQSSKRTVLVSEPGREPYFLKFPGEKLAQDVRLTERGRVGQDRLMAKLSFFERLRLDHGPKPIANGLEADEVVHALARSARHAGDSAIVPETAGLVFTIGEGFKLAILHRSFHLAGEAASRAGRSLVPLHALADPDFATSRDPARAWSSALLARFGGSSRRWLEQELAPKYAEFILDSLFRRGGHFEGHPQNVDLLLAPDGAIERLFVKDLSDVVDDPLLAHVTGGPRAFDRERVGSLGFMGDWKQTRRVERCGGGSQTAQWYRKFLWRVEYDFYSKDYALATRPADRARVAAPAAKFERALNAALRSGARERFLALGAERRAAGRPAIDYAPAAAEVRAILAPQTEVGARIAAIREALIKPYLVERFLPDRGRVQELLSRTDLVHGPDDGASRFSGMSAWLQPGEDVNSSVKVGSVDGHRVALCFGPEGGLERYAYGLSPTAA